MYGMGILPGPADLAPLEPIIDGMYTNSLNCDYYTGEVTWELSEAQVAELTEKAKADRISPIFYEDEEDDESIAPRNKVELLREELLGTLDFFEREKARAEVRDCRLISRAAYEGYVVHYCKPNGYTDFDNNGMRCGGDYTGEMLIKEPIVEPESESYFSCLTNLYGRFVWPFQYYFGSTKE